MRRRDHLLLISSRYPYGTQEAYLGTELAALRDYVPRITVAPLRANGGMPVHSVPAGVDVLSLPLTAPRTYLRALRTFRYAPRAAIGAISALLRSGDRGKVKNLAMLPAALALADWARSNAVTHVHGYWLSTPASAAFVAGSIAGIPWSATAHRWDIYERNALDVKARTASFIRTISTRGYTDLRSALPGDPKLVELRLGAEIPHSDGVALPARKRRFHIISPAALVPVKGHSDLLEAIALLRPQGVHVRCTLAGTGPERMALSVQARALRIDDLVVFTGHVDRARLLEWYRSGEVDAVVLASRADGPTMMEGLPSALIEALAFEVPVIATDSGSISELLAGDCGILVPPRSPLRIAEAIRSVYEAPALARERAQRGYDRVKRFHDAREQMRAFAGLLYPSPEVRS